MVYMSSYPMSHDHHSLTRAVSLFGSSNSTEVAIFTVTDRAQKLYGIGMNPNKGAVFGIECNSDISRANRLFSSERARTNKAKTSDINNVKSVRQSTKKHTKLHVKPPKGKHNLKAMWDTWNTTMGPKHKKNKGTSFVVQEKNTTDDGVHIHHVTVECIENNTVKSRCTFQISLAKGNDIAIITSIDTITTNHSFVTMNYVKKYIHNYRCQANKKSLKHVHVCSKENHLGFWTQNGFRSTDHVDSNTNKHLMVFELKDDIDCKKQ